jgi:hypothetical protein
MYQQHPCLRVRTARARAEWHIMPLRIDESAGCACTVGLASAISAQRLLARRKPCTRFRTNCAHLNCQSFRGRLYACARSPRFGGPARRACLPPCAVVLGGWPMR